MLVDDTSNDLYHFKAFKNEFLDWYRDYCDKRGHAPSTDNVWGQYTDLRKDELRMQLVNGSYESLSNISDLYGSYDIEELVDNMVDDEFVTDFSIYGEIITEVYKILRLAVLMDEDEGVMCSDIDFSTYNPHVDSLILGSQVALYVIPRVSKRTLFLIPERGTYFDNGKT